MRVTLMFVLMFAAAYSVWARSFEVAAWRGETTAARVPDFAEIGKAPDGIGVRMGVLKPVRYAPVPHSLERREVCDRLVWDEDEMVPAS